MKRSTFILLILFPFFTFSQIINIPDDYPTIQEGIDAAADGDVVLVDQGIYTENINIYAKAITVTSNYINTLDSADIYNTIIDGSQPSDTTLASVVTFSINSDTNTVICGFTIKNGKGSSSLGDRFGGGILCFDGGKIIHNRIIDNSFTADEHALGGGIWLDGLPSSYFIVKDNIIENNQMENTNPGKMCWGVGIGIYNGNIIIENNIIRSNSAYGRPYGVGIYCFQSTGIINNNIIKLNIGYHELANKSRGGGMYLVDNYSTLTISNNEITHNQLIPDVGFWESGGGICILSTGGIEFESIHLDKNIISHNSAGYGGGVGVAGNYSVEFSNNVIHNNTSESYGAGIFFQNYNKKGSNVEVESHVVSNRKENGKDDIIPLLVNNTITGNISDNNGGGLSMNMDSEYLLFNNIISGNLAGSDENQMFLSSSSNTYLYNNNIDTNEISGTGSWEGDDNIDVDPMITDDTCHLGWGSFCVNAGILSVTIGHNEYTIPTTDIDGDIRPYLDTKPDIGADEASILYVGTEESENLSFKSAIVSYPNPFTMSIIIEYELTQPETVTITFYNQFGKQVYFIKEKRQRGLNKVVWTPNNLADGIYYFKLQVSEQVVSGKVIKMN